MGDCFFCPFFFVAFFSPLCTPSVFGAPIYNAFNIFILPTKKKTEEDYEDNLEGNKTSEHDKIINNIFHSVPPHSSSKTLEKN